MSEWPQSTIGNTSTKTVESNSSPAVLSVEQLNRQIRQLIEGELDLVWVQGELSNFKAHSSGHFYFSLKDAKSQIRAVMFRGHNTHLKFKPTDGLEVIIRGRVTVYEPRGDYQITCEMMEPVGAGALQKAFEQLKLKLKAEGLFEAARKKPIPGLPQHVVIVTSPTGAAIRDMINVLTRRNKMVNVTLIPTVVQGEAAAPQIVQALQTAFRLPNVDVIIIGRGGGSIEDLWAFNNEDLARTIASSLIPVISAVGHEIDFTIADFVADLRAPTPSAAAELVMKSSEGLIQKLQLLDRILSVTIHKQIRTDMQKIKGLTGRLVDPKRKLQDLIQRADDLQTRLGQSVARYFEKRRLSMKLLEQRLVKPDQVIAQHRSRIDFLSTQMKNLFQRRFESLRSRNKEAMSLLDGLSPLRVVERGYSLTTAQGAVVKDAAQVKPKDEIQIYLMKGQIRAQVISASSEHEKESPWTLKKN
jgi:exodeoxyribonuclease VII large subunit